MVPLNITSIEEVPGGRAPADLGPVTFEKGPPSGGARWHPYADLFPWIEGEALRKFYADVRRHGVREPIVFLDGQILDGRNRYMAARDAGIEYPRADYIGSDPLGFVLSLNLDGRRHLTESQRGAIGAKLATLGVGRPVSSLPQQGQAPVVGDAGTAADSGAAASSETPPSGGISAEAAAKILNVGTRTIERAKTVQELGAEGLFEAVERGATTVAAAEAIARLPKDRQVEILAEVAKSPDGKKAFAEVAKKARRERQETKKNARAVREEILGRRQAKLPDARFGVILAVPEWQFEPRSRATGLDRSADNHYPTSSLEVIKSRDVPSIAADDCVLFLWATAPMLPQALEVLSAWGFTYRTHRIWRKAESAGAGLVLGTGYWFRNAHELVLVGTRGEVPAPAMGTQPASIFDAPPRRHSQKPADIHGMIEAMFPTLPKIELNARSPREGWSAWGNEAEAAARHVVARDRHIDILRDIARGMRSGMHDPADPDVAALIAAGEISVTKGHRGRILAPGIARLEELSGDAAEEAAVATKKLPIELQAKNSYLRDVIGDDEIRTAPHDYRTPSGTPIGELVNAGTIVRTNYGTGPYVVVDLRGPYFYEPAEGGRYEHWSLNMTTPAEAERAATKKRKPKADSWINECVAVDGRILRLFRDNTDEVVLIDPPSGGAIPIGDNP